MKITTNQILKITEEALKEMGWGRTLMKVNGYEISWFPGGFHVAVDSFSDPIKDECSLREAIVAAIEAPTPVVDEEVEG